MICKNCNGWGYIGWVGLHKTKKTKCPVCKGDKKYKNDLIGHTHKECVKFDKGNGITCINADRENVCAGFKLKEVK